MRRGIQTILAGIIAIGLVVLALWTWQASPDLVSQWAVSRSDVMVWAVRCGAIAIFALSQLLLLRFAVGIPDQSRAIDDLLRLSSGVACVIAFVSAVALGLAGR